MAAGPNTPVTIVDGSLDFSGGVDSLKVTTIQSDQNPNGLARNQLAWLNNATTRDGGITQRTGWQPLGHVHDGNALYQGGSIYEPDAENPYLIVSIGGNIWKIDLNFTIPPANLSAYFGLTNPPNEPQAYFCQAEKFLVIQAGDNVTLPLFWDGATLRRSKGITNPAVAPGSPGVNEIPAATAMDYYQGRLWYAQGRRYSAGDMVGGASGTAANEFRDAVLNVTENPLVLGGDGFTVPTNAGNIRAIRHTATLDATLGQGQLYIFTAREIYTQDIPVTRTDWIAANANNQPKQNVVQIVNGSVNDRSLVAVNGDLFYQSLEPGIRSLFSAIRYFGQWGNVQISANENRILQFNDRSLLHFGSGIYFDNRMIQTALPVQRQQGVVHTALVPLDFMPINSFGQQSAPVWQGMYEGLDFLQLFVANFGGLERAFGMIVSRVDATIQLWELTNSQRFENGDNRVTWIAEFPAYTWNREFTLKQLRSAELWIDKLFGEVEFTMEYRPDSDPCWKPWRKWKQCSSRNSCEDANNPICYPITPNRESFRATMTLPEPPKDCESVTGRPAFIAYQFQPRMIIKGWCRIRGILLHAEIRERKLYDNLVC